MRTQTKAVIARLDRAIQHSRDASDDARSRGVLDRPVKPGDDGWGAADSYSPIPTDSNFKQPRCLQTQLRDLAAHPREFVLEFSRPRNQRAQGMPGARCARSLARNKKAHEHSHHGHAGITRAFPAQWFTAYSVLSPVTGLFCHCRLRIAPQAWRQRRGVRTTRLCRPPQRCSSRALLASTASRLTSVTIASRPSCRDGTRES